MRPTPSSSNGDQPAAPGGSTLETPSPPPGPSQLQAPGSASDTPAADTDTAARSAAADPEAQDDTASDDAADVVADGPDAATQPTAGADADPDAEATAGTDPEPTVDGAAAAREGAADAADAEQDDRTEAEAHGDAAPSHDAGVGTAATDEPDAVADEGPTVYALPGGQAHADSDDPTHPAGDAGTASSGRDVQADADSGEPAVGDSAADPDAGGGEPNGAAAARADVVADEGPAIARSGDGGGPEPTGGDAAADTGTGGDGDGTTGLEAQAREAERAVAQSEAVAAVKADGSDGAPEPKDAGARSEAQSTQADRSTVQDAGAVPAEEPERVSAAPTLADLGHAGADEGADAGPLRPGDVAETRIAVWSGDAAQALRGEWHEVKARFVDEPEAALAEAKALVTRAIQQLAETLLAEQVDLDPRRQSATPDTEAMRVAMRRYRDFLDRVLAL
jgi:hypothetical protein